MNNQKEFHVIEDHDFKMMYCGFRNHKSTVCQKELSLVINKFLNRKISIQVSLEDFQGYLKQFVVTHKRCEESCIHLKRFLNKIRFTSRQWHKRKLFDTKK